MATEIPEAGYASLRALIDSSQTAPDQWDYIALKNDSGTEIFRDQISTFSGASVTTEDQDSDGNDETIVITLTVSGSDLDSLPQTVTTSEVYDSGAGGSALSTDTFSSAEMTASGDTLTVDHHIEVPQVS